MESGERAKIAESDGNEDQKCISRESSDTSFRRGVKKEEYGRTREPERRG